MGVETTVLVHIGTNYATGWSLREKLRLHGRILKSRPPKIAFSGMNFTCRASQTGGIEKSQCMDEILELGEGFTFVRHWDTFWPELYKRDCP